MTAPVKIGLFRFGEVRITAAADQALSEEDVVHAFCRHLRGDWGDLCSEDKARNEEALVEGLRLFSRYVTKEEIVFYIITEWNRSCTTILLPQDY